MDGSWMDGGIHMKWKHALAFAFGWVEHGYRMINFLIQSHNKSHAHWRWRKRRIPTDRFQFPAFHVTASPLSLSLRWPAILQRFACPLYVFWWGRLGLQSLLQAFLRVFASPAIIIIVVVVVCFLLQQQFAFSTRLSRLFFITAFEKEEEEEEEVLLSWGFPLSNFACNNHSHRCLFCIDWISFLFVPSSLAFFREQAFFLLFFPVAVEEGAWSSLWRFPCLATAWFFLVHGSVIFQLCGKHIQSFCSCFCATAVTLLVSEGESFLYRGKKDLSGDQNHVECPGYVTRRHD